MDLSEFDLVITSCSGYIARGFKVGKKTKVIAYCHTPPRFLYGYEMSVDWQKYWIVKVYAVIVNHFLRQFDFWSAQSIKTWIANSKNVQIRIEKFYRKGSVVIYPPVDTKIFDNNFRKEDYFLIVSRLAGAKGLEEAAMAAKCMGIKLKIAGGSAGYNQVKSRLEKMSGGQVELLGRVTDDELIGLYAKAKGFVALARQEDFGMTVVEAQAAGTPVIVFRGGGFLESVIEGETGIFVDDTSVDALVRAFREFNSKKWDRKKIKANVKRFDKKIFEEQIKKLVSSI